ncbi:MAG: GNAT family N-acetyltransferase [Pseudomonadota bacterium]
MAKPTIRDADSTDEAVWRRLWAGYTDFYEVDVPEPVTALTWSRVLDPTVPMFARMAQLGDSVVGFTISTLHPSTWTADLNCYLEDLFVDPGARGHGVGRALIDDLLVLAKDKGWDRLYWHTNSGNTTARALYDRYTKADDFVRYRIPLSDYNQRGNSEQETIG